jgi:hypothetical protein
MKAPRIDPGLRELIGLSLMAGGGCGLALSQGDLLFIAIFGAACAVTIIESMRRFMPETSARSLISNHDGRWKSATIR